MIVQTDHQVIVDENDVMHLIDCQTGVQIAYASRTSPDSDWMVAQAENVSLNLASSGATDAVIPNLGKIPTVDSVTASTRVDALDALYGHVITILGGTGYSVLEPTGLRERP